MAGLGYQYKVGKGLGACEMVWQGLLNKEIFSFYTELESQSIQAHRCVH